MGNNATPTGESSPYPCSYSPPHLGLPKITGLDTTNPPFFKQLFARDLAWMILNPPLIQPGHYFCPAQSHQHGAFGYGFWVPSSRWQVHAWQAIAPLLLRGNRAEKRLDAIAQSSASNQSQRLGLYFEKLMTFWFENSPRHELIKHGLPIRGSRSSSQGPKSTHQKTLGECDYLVFDKATEQLQHWEVAVKFYLGVSNEYRTRWVGPNLKDRLDRKVHHTLNHQLPLSGTPEAIEAIQDTLLPASARSAISGAARRALSALKTTGNTTSSDGMVRILWLKGALYERLRASDKPSVRKSTDHDVLSEPHGPQLALNSCRQQGPWILEQSQLIDSALSGGKNSTVTQGQRVPASGFEMELPRLNWLGTRSAREVLAALNEKDKHLLERKPKPGSTVGHAIINDRITAQHRAHFSRAGVMASRYFRVSDQWLNQAIQQHL